LPFMNKLVLWKIAFSFNCWSTHLVPDDQLSLGPACGVRRSMKSRMTSEPFVGLIRAGDVIHPVKRNCASTEDIDSGAKN
jgi:hypothetical protein